MASIYLLIGAPGSGKTWVCNQLSDKYDYLPHDAYPTPKVYISDIKRLAQFSDKPVLIETPFSISQYLEPLTRDGFTVIPVFIIESKDVTAKRYENREQKPIPQGHLSRIDTYISRAAEYGAFRGTSQEVLEHLKNLR